MLFIKRRGISFYAIIIWRYWNIMNVVFCTLDDSLFTATSQQFYLVPNWLIKILTSSISPLHSLTNDHIRQLKVVSSAYKMKFRLSLPVCISFISIMNISGSRIKSYDTPVSFFSNKSRATIIFNILCAFGQITLSQFNAASRIP